MDFRLKNVNVIILKSHNSDTWLTSAATESSLNTTRTQPALCLHWMATGYRTGIHRFRGRLFNPNMVFQLWHPLSFNSNLLPNIMKLIQPHILTFLQPWLFHPFSVLSLLFILPPHSCILSAELSPIDRSDLLGYLPGGEWNTEHYLTAFLSGRLNAAVHKTCTN